MVRSCSCSNEHTLCKLRHAEQVLQHAKTFLDAIASHVHASSFKSADSVTSTLYSVSLMHTCLAIICKIYVSSMCAPASLMVVAACKPTEQGKIAVASIATAVPDLLCTLLVYD